MMRVVACCGTFDGNLHPGHISFLRKAKSYGNWLVVYINTDKVVRRNKSRQPLHSQAERIAHVTNLQIASQVIAFEGDDDQNLRQIEALRPDVFCLSEGNNYPFDARIEKLIMEHGGQIIKISRLDGYSTTELHFS